MDNRIKLTKKKQEEIYLHYLKTGSPLSFYGKKYNVNKATISDILTKMLKTNK